ncbi:hypothetical protein Pcinc_016455 [Petrolisthes cinctipes]|uniref:CUB domain-containing protein n=1 Tax=Petrolisthes cinctipes TaxID=88211 RepID=A0AAE1FTL1_PETCI|nr:hypothetical protein Pcinc_016455 [Petrolisthes cinctipes]
MLVWWWWRVAAAGTVLAGVLSQNVTLTSTSLVNQFLLSPLAVVRLENSNCDADLGRTGTCLTLFECYARGGVKTNLCGNGFGVCCLIVAKENGVSYGNNTLILKDKFDSGVDITYTIRRLMPSICQIRLDVRRLYLYRPENNGKCETDYMTINQDDKIGKICGLTENIHFYLDVTSEVVFTFHTSASVSFTRDWEIYVQQLMCDFMSTNAPQGCGQWYWGTSGTIDIWNNVDPTTPDWYYLHDQSYAICVRWEAGYCSISYTESLQFRPYCSDLFERPFTTTLLRTCDTSPPTSLIPLTYTVTEGLQEFFVGFKDGSNLHEGSPGLPFQNPSIMYVQNQC